MVSQHSLHLSKHSPLVLSLLKQQGHDLKQENHMPEIYQQTYMIRTVHEESI